MRRLDALPIRWRLALTSAGLTFLILLLFAVVVGMFTAQRVRQNFDDDLRATTADLQERVRIRSTLFEGPRVEVSDDIAQLAAAGGGALRVVGMQGRVFAQTAGAPDLGPPAEAVRDASGYRVVSRPVLAGQLGQPVAFVQYGKPKRSVNSTVARIRLFLALGVLGGSALALLAGLAVARRAMRPIAGLTAAAKRVTRTRDPAAELPRPVADDEVADLSRTLEEMLGALKAAQSEIEGMLTRQREFVADASHELRTPLTSVLANLELLEAQLEGEDAEIARSALRSSLRMRRLVGDLLLLARADAGQRAMREALDLGAVVRDAAGEVASVAPDHDLSVDAPLGLVVHGSRDELHRLVTNLVDNAVAHTPPGTPVRVALRRRGEEAVLAVEDEGPGVPPELRERIFDRFVQGSRHAGRGNAVGSGLGLAIVRAVARTHGGSVELEDADVPGARFVVRLEAMPPGTPVGDTTAAQGLPARTA